MNTTKLGRKELKVTVNNYILSCVDSSDYKMSTPTDKEKVNFVMSCFQDEYVKNNPQSKNNNEITLFASWIQGLPSSFNIDFHDHIILEIAKAWGLLAPDATERKEDQILSNWWNFIANKFFQLYRILNKS